MLLVMAYQVGVGHTCDLQARWQQQHWLQERLASYSQQESPANSTSLSRASFLPLSSHAVGNGPSLSVDFLFSILNLNQRCC